MTKKMYVNAILPMMKLITFVLTKMKIVVVHGNLLDFEVIASIPNNPYQYLSWEKTAAAAADDDVDIAVDYMIEKMVTVSLLQTLIGIAIVVLMMMSLKWLILFWVVVAVVVII